MSELLYDPLNLDILENICSGTGIGVNISALSKTFQKHRNTIQNQVKALFEHRIINHITTKLSGELGRQMENIVSLKLLKKYGSNKIFYGKNSYGHEVD